MRNEIRIEKARSGRALAEVVGERGETRGELIAAFDKVAPAGDWKLSIDARIPASTRDERALIARSVRFFTGSVATIERDGDFWTVKAAGYYAAVGA